MKELTSLRIGIIGFGNLGSAIAKRLIEVQVPPLQIQAIARASNRGAITELGVTTVEDGHFAPLDILICTTKPGQFEKAWQSVQSVAEYQPLIISFMAMLSLARLQEITGSSRIVRAMTTTPCVIGRGIGAWISTAELDATNRELATTVLESLGTHLPTEQESEIAIATVLSSINGWIFELIHALEQGLNFIGAPRKYQELIVTVIESAITYRRSLPKTHLIALADAVTSPGGTTAQLRQVLERAGFNAILAEGIKAAHERAKG